MTIHTEENATTEERVSRLEGAYRHLATQADVVDVLTAIAESETRMTQRIDNLRTEDEERRIRSLEERVSYLEKEKHNRADIIKTVGGVVGLLNLVLNLLKFVGVG